MTLDRLPFRPWAVTRPRPQPAPEPGRRVARVRPYYRDQVHHPNRPARPVGQAAQAGGRAVLERVLTGLRALDARPATQATIQAAVQSTVPRRPVPLALSPAVVGDSAATATDARPALVGVSAGDASPTPPGPVASGSFSVRSVLGRELVPLVRAVLARRPEAALPAARVEPSPDAIRTQPLNLVGVGS